MCTKTERCLLDICHVFHTSETCDGFTHSGCSFQVVFWTLLELLPTEILTSKIMVQYLYGIDGHSFTDQKKTMPTRGHYKHLGLDLHSVLPEVNT